MTPRGTCHFSVTFLSLSNSHFFVTFLSLFREKVQIVVSQRISYVVGISVTFLSLSCHFLVTFLSLSFHFSGKKCKLCAFANARTLACNARRSHVEWAEIRHEGNTAHDDQFQHRPPGFCSHGTQFVLAIWSDQRHAPPTRRWCIFLPKHAAPQPHPRHHGPHTRPHTDPAPNRATNTPQATRRAHRAAQPHGGHPKTEPRTPDPARGRPQPPPGRPHPHAAPVTRNYAARFARAGRGDFSPRTRRRDAARSPQQHTPRRRDGPDPRTAETGNPPPTDRPAAADAAAVNARARTPRSAPSPPQTRRICFPSAALRVGELLVSSLFVPVQLGVFCWITFAPLAVATFPFGSLSGHFLATFLSHFSFGVTFLVTLRSHFSHTYPFRHPLPTLWGQVHLNSSILCGFSCTVVVALACGPQELCC